jgi:hypothetical protein
MADITLDFSSPTCYGGGVCGGGDRLDQTGSSAIATVTYSDLSDNTGSSLRYWGGGAGNNFGPLFGVAFAGGNDISTGRIDFVPVSLTGIRLLSFDLGSWFECVFGAECDTQGARATTWKVINLADNSTIATGTPDMPANTGLTVPSSMGLLTSGFAIEWSNTAYNIAIDNIKYTDSDPRGSTVPEPATYGLMAAGLAAIIGLASRRTA